MPLILCVFAVNTDTKEAELLTNLQPEDACLNILHQVLTARVILKAREAEKAKEEEYQALRRKNEATYNFKEEKKN